MTAVREGAMKKLGIGLGALAAVLGVPAMAADLPVGAPVYAERPAAIGLWNWTGFYVGGNLGYARDSSSVDISAVSVPAGVTGVPLLSLPEVMGGVTGGVQVGANWQTGNGVFGIEADLQGTGQSVSGSMSVVDVNGAIAAPGTIITASNTDRITSFGTVRGRIGIASGRWLFYATGGWAYWTWSSTVTVSGLGTASFSNFKGGGTLGGGVELALTDSWTVKAEYLFLESTGISNTPFVARPDVLVNSRIRENLFRIGVNYAFFTGSVGCRPHDC
jgi:outer membrane immunogenic protein